MPRGPSTHVDSAAAVGERLREARVRAGLTQRDLAFEGCTAAYVSRIEAGARIPSFQVLREFSRRLGVSADYLATGDSFGDLGDGDLIAAELAARTGQVEEARRLYNKLLSTAASAAVEASARAGLGLVAFRAGDHAEAIADLEAALRSTAISARESRAVADALGRAYVLTARYEEALALFERFYEKAKADADSAEIIRFAVLLANTLIDRCNYAHAEEILAEVLDSAKAAIDPVTRAGIYWSQSRLHSSQNRHDLAAQYARHAFETLEVTEHTLYTAKALVLLAQLENERGNSQEALDLFDQALPAIVSSGNAYEHGLLLLERSKALAALGESEQAIAEALGAVGRFKDGAPLSAGRGYALAAKISREIGDEARAAELYELAIEVIPVHDRHRVDALTALAELYEAQGNKDRAFALLKEAVQTSGASVESGEPA